MLQKDLIEKKFKITAAKLTLPMQGPTHLIYVGKLDSSTEETALREHLSQIGISNEEVADVIPLKC